MSAEETVVEVEKPNVVFVEDAKPEPEKVEAAEEPKAEEAVQQENDEGQERDESGKFKKNATQARIDELTKAKHEAAREAAYWRGLAEARAAKETTPEAPQGKPTADQFNDYAEFVEALTEWKATEKVNAALSQRDAKQQEAVKADSWQQRAAAAKAELPDFDSVLANSTAPMSQAMAEVIKESDLGPKVAYHLAQNPDVAARLSGLSPTQAAREIGRIEASLSAPKPVPEKRTTSAPTPPTPIGSGRSTVGDPAKMSQADYLAWRANAMKVN